jgi:hypothetical protein
MYVIQHCFICRPSDSTVSEDAGIEPRTVATSGTDKGGLETRKRDLRSGQRTEDKEQRT